MRKSIHKTTLASIAIGGLALGACQKEPQTKPNILFIAVDDLKPMLGCYGDSLIKTPNIDRLASRGVVFRHAYCQQALSGPSRASLLTGLYPDATKVWAFNSIREQNPEVITLPQHFRNNGYITYNIGKIFDYRTVDKLSDSASWDWVFPLNEADYAPHYGNTAGTPVMYHYQSPELKSKWNHLKKEALIKGEDTLKYAANIIRPAVECLSYNLPDNGYKDGIFTSLALQKLALLKKQNKPFFMAVGYHKPHLPFVAPKKYWDLYQRDQIKLTPNPHQAKEDTDFPYLFGGDLTEYTNTEGKRSYDVLKQGRALSDEEQRELIHGYMACVSYIDAQIGKLMAALEETGLAKNTIIVLWGDHGFHLGDHNQWGKSTNFEQATRSPLILSFPDFKGKYSHISSPVEFVDIYPTLCELAQLPAPSFLQGKSLCNIMRENPETGYAISQFQRGESMGYAIRDQRYRYVKWIEKGPHTGEVANNSNVIHQQLFDYQKDPWEFTNLARQPEYKDILLNLDKQLDEFLTK